MDRGPPVGRDATVNSRSPFTCVWTPHETPRERTPSPSRGSRLVRRHPRKETPPLPAPPHTRGPAALAAAWPTLPPRNRARTPLPPFHSVRERHHDVVWLKSPPISPRTGPARSRVRSSPPPLPCLLRHDACGPVRARARGVARGRWGQTVLAVSGALVPARTGRASPALG